MPEDFLDSSFMNVSTPNTIFDYSTYKHVEADDHHTSHQCLQQRDNELFGHGSEYITSLVSVISIFFNRMPLTSCIIANKATAPIGRVALREAANPRRAATRLAP